MEELTDKAFIKNFSLVLVGLVIFTIIIVFVARSFGFKEEQDVASQGVLAEQRIAPVADVYTDEASIAMPAAAPAAAPAPVSAPAPAQGAATAGAFDGSLDAKMLYDRVCASCHASGVAGAPQPGSDAMAQRAEKGLDAVVQTAIDGLNIMPARGGRPDLTDEQIKVIVEFMLQ